MLGMIRSTFEDNNYVLLSMFYIIGYCILWRIEVRDDTYDGGVLPILVVMGAMVCNHHAMLLGDLPQGWLVR